MRPGESKRTTVRVGFARCQRRRMVQHFCPIFQRGRFGQAPKDAAEIRRVPKAAANGDVFEFEVVIAEEKLAARDAHVGEVIDERHVAVTMKHPREMIGADGEQPGDGIAGDIVLEIALQIDAHAFEETLRAIFGLWGGGFVHEALDTLNERGCEVIEGAGWFLHGEQFQHCFEYMWNRAADWRGHGKLVGHEMGHGASFCRHNAHAELLLSKQERHDFDFAFPGRVVPAVGRNEQCSAGPQADRFDFTEALDLILIRAPERNFQSGESDDMAEQGRVQLAATDVNLPDRASGKKFSRPPIQRGSRFHKGPTILTRRLQK